jgi:FkbM family methyltransferase
MAVAAAKYDPLRPPSLFESLQFQPKRLAALWRWRNYAEDDSQFINRLLNVGIKLDVIWDVGASNGAWSWIVGRALPKMQHHLFEPLAQHTESYANVLRHHLAAHKNWTLHPFALGERDEEATIFADAASYGSSLVPNAYAEANWTGVDIAVHRGDTILAKSTAPQPDIIKADTQGFELALLKGMPTVLLGTKVLLLETWLSRGYGPETPLLTEIISWLAERDFVPVEFGDGYRDQTGLLRSVDVFFIRKDLAETAGFVL